MVLKFGILVTEKKESYRFLLREFYEAIDQEKI